MAIIQPASGIRPDAAINTKENTHAALSQDFSGGLLSAASTLRGLKSLNPPLASEFKKQFKELIARTGFKALNSLAQLANRVLDTLVASGLLSADRAKTIKKSSLAGEIRLSAQNRKSAAVSDAEDFKDKTLPETVTAPPGFLWKPVADSPPHGLVVLTPKEWSDKVIKISILDPNGSKILATGRDSGIANGDRKHFRFDNRGASFPAGSLLQLSFNDGSKKLILISKPAERMG